MRVLIADKFESQGVAGLIALGCEVVHEPGLSPETLPEAVGRVDPHVLIVRSTRVQAPAIEAGRSLGMIVRAGSGYDNIDGSKATQRGIPVCNCPGMNAVAVAELAMAHLLNLDRRLVAQDAQLKAGRWNKAEYSKARGLKGMHLLVHGYGAIGREVAQRARAFGMHVHATSRHHSADEIGAMGVHFVDSSREGLLAALPKMDAVTVHVPLGDETKSSCDAAFFAAMKPGAYFINTSRGPVVDERALAEACRTRGIRAGLDVYCNQPSATSGDFAPDIAKDPGVCCTHHCGASTDQAQNAVAEEVVRLVEVYTKTGACENVVNPESLARRAQA